MVQHKWVVWVGVSATPRHRSSWLDSQFAAGVTRVANRDFRRRAENAEKSPSGVQVPPRLPAADSCTLVLQPVGAAKRRGTESAWKAPTVWMTGRS